MIDLEEFKQANRNSRFAELSLTKVLSKLGVNLQNMNGQFDAFKSSIQRRRLMKKQYEEDLEKMTTTIIGKLCVLLKTEVPGKDPQDQKTYNTLRDTFVTICQKPEHS